MSTRLNILLLLSVLVVMAMIASLHLGMRFYPPNVVWGALSGRETGTDALIIATLRVPRTLIAACCGAALGLSGLLMQAASRNPLAEPGLLGVNAGAALCVVLSLTMFGLGSMTGLAVAAGAGALFAITLVLVLTALGEVRADPTSILLVGVTSAALFGAITQVILLSNEAALETLLFWLAGSFADRDTALLWIGVPVLLAGLAATLWLGPALDLMQTDDDSAAALGVPVQRMRYLAFMAAALLAGGTVAMAGPVVFLGLVTPHVARRLCPGAGHIWLAFACVLTGALIALLADILARIIVAPAEAPIGTVLALVGVPVLILQLRRGDGRRMA
ncbi:FecCD family ABC transporter permease [Paracoccus albus]|uniref:FecCD family ABC transporter permease n=1 Tax=Paracoccus albus TaxID=3017784 RepID=UPI0022EFE24C|nr:iron ABC transporter permease [Paracoccus albus]WBU61306.1 iron ABC transporter permease [Paracoccus albus]